MGGGAAGVAEVDQELVENIHCIAAKACAEMLPADLGFNTSLKLEADYTVDG